MGSDESHFHVSMKRETDVYLTLNCHSHRNDSCIKMGSDESHFHVSMKRETDVYLTLNCHSHRNDSCIKMGSDESHFHVSLKRETIPNAAPAVTTRMIRALSWEVMRSV